MNNNISLFQPVKFKRTENSQLEDGVMEVTNEGNFIKVGKLKNVTDETNETISAEEVYDYKANWFFNN